MNQEGFPKATSPEAAIEILPMPFKAPEDPLQRENLLLDPTTQEQQDQGDRNE